MMKAGLLFSSEISLGLVLYKLSTSWVMAQNRSNLNLETSRSVPHHYSSNVTFSSHKAMLAGRTSYYVRQARLSAVIEFQITFILDCLDCWTSCNKRVQVMIF